MTLQEKTAIVTGATRGIGKAIAERLGSDGANVVVNYRAREGATESAQELVQKITANGGRAVTAEGDVSTGAGVRGLFDVAENTYGGVDIVVNNAAVFTAAPLEYLPEAEFDRLLSVNLKSVYFAGQEAINRLRDGGRIINLSAHVPAGGLAFMGAYGATKAGVEVLTRSLAHALGCRSITVNAVKPGPTDTDMLADDARQMEEQITTATPLGGFGRPEDIAATVAWLASEDARWVTAQVITASGGFE